MKKLDNFYVIDSHWNRTNGRYYYAHPNGTQWDVIQSPSPRGTWNTNNISIAVCPDLRVANLLAETMSQVEIKPRTP